MARKKMTEEEKLSWEALYCYVKTNIMEYDENQSLSKSTVLRLKGLSTNKFMENKNVETTANYSYEVILNTFKYCYSSIQKAVRTNMFVDEQHKVNYIFKIVEKNLNTVYLKMKSLEKTKEDAKNTVVEITSHTGADYQRKTKEVNNKLLNDLW